MYEQLISQNSRTKKYAAQNTKPSVNQVPYSSMIHLAIKSGPLVLQRIRPETVRDRAGDITATEKELSHLVRVITGIVSKSDDNTVGHAEQLIELFRQELNQYEEFLRQSNENNPNLEQIVLSKKNKKLQDMIYLYGTLELQGESLKSMERMLTDDGGLDFGGKITMSVSNVYSQLNKRNKDLFEIQFARLQTLTTPKGALEAVRNAGKNLTANRLLVNPGYGTYDEAKMPANVQNAFVNRLTLTTNLIARVKAEVGDDVIVTPTGSDPHFQGRQALFLEYPDGSKRVYKDRSLRVDDALTGNNGIFATINQYYGQPIELPVMEINPDTRTEEYVERTGTERENPVTKEDAWNFYYQLGMMQCAGTILSLVDIHADNVMFIPNGPIITDAECNFLDSVGTCIESGLYSVLSTAEIEGKPANSLFYIDTGGPEGIMSTEAHRLYTEKYLYFFNYHVFQDAYQCGFDNLLNTLWAREQEFLSDYAEKLRQVDWIRMLPLSTDEFASFINEFLFNPKHEKLLKTYTHKILMGIRNKHNYKFLRKATINRSAIYNVLERAGKEGTIPTVEFNMDDGCIYMDQTIIGTTNRTKESMIFDMKNRASGLIETTRQRGRRWD